MDYILTGNEDLATVTAELTKNNTEQFTEQGNDNLQIFLSNNAVSRDMSTKFVVLFAFCVLHYPVFLARSHDSNDFVLIV